MAEIIRFQIVERDARGDDYTYPMTVEDIIKELEKMGYTVTKEADNG